MIASFYDAFRSVDEPRVLPRRVVNELSKNLPRGYRYDIQDNGHYMIVPDEREVSCSFRVTVNREANGIPDDISQDELTEYLYRMQKPVRLENVRLTDGEHSVPIEDIYRDPLTHESSGTVTEIWAYPQPFPDARTFVLSDGKGVSQDVSIGRVAYESMDAVKFANTSFPALVVEMVFYEKDDDELGSPAGASFIRVSAKPDGAACTRDAVTALLLLKAFALGTLTIDGLPLGRELHYREGQKDVCPQVDDALKYWQTLERLEEALGIEFDPGAECDEEDAGLLRSLAYSLLDGQDTVICRPFSHFHIGFTGDGNVDELNERVGEQGLSLSFVDIINANIMEASFSVCEASVLVDMTLERIVYDDDGKGAEFYVTDAPGTTFKIVKRMFRTEQEALDGMGAMYERHAEYRPED